MLQDKNEFQAETYISTEGFQGRFAYSPVRFIGTQLNTQAYSRKFKYFSESNKHNIIEVAIGSYYNFNFDINAEYYYGLGYGTSSNPHAIYDGANYREYNHGYYYKSFHHIGIGYNLTNDFRIILACRYSDIKYRIPDMHPDKWIGNGINRYKIVEPAIVISHKLSKKLQLSYSYNRISPKWSDKDVLNNGHSIGISVKYVINFKKNK
jgi:hypothetical protein